MFQELNLDWTYVKPDVRISAEYTNKLGERCQRAIQMSHPFAEGKACTTMFMDPPTVDKRISALGGKQA